MRRDLLRSPGVGPYGAENPLRMDGRPDGRALDSWLRAKYAKVYHGGRRVTARTLGRRSARFGEWAGLVPGCDMARDGFGEPASDRALLTGA